MPRNSSEDRETKVIDLKGRRVIPGLNDSHLHVIRGGLNYNMELRWDGVPSLADALRMLKEQAQRTPAPDNGCASSEAGLNSNLPNGGCPPSKKSTLLLLIRLVFILHLYCRALLNKAALRACGYTKDTPNPPGGEIQRSNGQGNPTRLPIAPSKRDHSLRNPGEGPKLPPEYQGNSTRHFMRELNRLGFTSVI